MVSFLTGNKDRLYVALYIRGGAPKMPGGEDKYVVTAPQNVHLLTQNRYHWALLACAKNEDEDSRGTRFHAKENMLRVPFIWEYTEEHTGSGQTHRLLVRIAIAKIRDTAALHETLRRVPIRAGQPGHDDWNCVGWVREAVEMLQDTTNVLGTAVLDWATVRDTVMGYVQRKIDEHRFDGTRPGEFDVNRPATYDLMEGKEVNA